MPVLVSTPGIAAMIGVADAHFLADDPPALRAAAKQAANRDAGKNRANHLWFTGKQLATTQMPGSWALRNGRPRHSRCQERGGWFYQGKRKPSGLALSKLLYKS